MKTQASASMFVLAIIMPLTGALAQSAFVTGTLNWTEVIAGTTTPVASPNGAIDPGEAARIGLSLSFTPLVGMPVSYNYPPPGGVAPVAGLSSAAVSFGATAAQGGTWSHLAIALGFLGALGTIAPDGSLIGVEVWHPFPLAPGAFPLSTNPLPDVWRAVWTPPAYNPRLVAFELIQGAHTLSLWVHTGFDPTGNPTFGFAEAIGNTGLVINIPVAPAPAALAPMLGLGILVLRRARR